MTPRALEQPIRRVSAIRATVLDDLEADDPTAQFSQFTERTRTVIRLAVEQARATRAAGVGTEQLLHGMLGEATNLALHVLRAMEIDPAHVGRALANAAPAPESWSASQTALPGRSCGKWASTSAPRAGRSWLRSPATPTSAPRRARHPRTPQR